MQKSPSEKNDIQQAKATWLVVNNLQETSQGCQEERTIGQKPARCSIPRGTNIQAALIQKEYFQHIYSCYLPDICPTFSNRRSISPFPLNSCWGKDIWSNCELADKLPGLSPDVPPSSRLGNSIKRMGNTVTEWGGYLFFKHFQTW